MKKLTNDALPAEDLKRVQVQVVKQQFLQHQLQRLHHLRIPTEPSQ
jgi:hypothetical protein